MEKTLLQLAKESKGRTPRNVPVSNEEIELAVAFLNKEVSWGQLELVYKSFKKTSINYGRIATALRVGVESGKVKVKYIP